MERGEKKEEGGERLVAEDQGKEEEEEEEDCALPTFEGRESSEGGRGGRGGRGRGVEGEISARQNIIVVSRPLPFYGIKGGRRLVGGNSAITDRGSAAPKILP